mmetsp:Transcript_44458/g.128481  ORF Transcript_44458/g.128481 Transcript_44458/m.128481 type:complete len:235 (+) Transcript_44458:1230-1934(+)
MRVLSTISERSCAAPHTPRGFALFGCTTAGAAGASALRPFRPLAFFDEEARSSASSSSWSASPPGGGSSSPAAMAEVTPMAPTSCCPGKAGRCKETSRKGSSRSVMRLQRQQSVATQKRPAKCRATRSCTSSLPSAPRFASSNSSETEPRSVRRNSWASCCSLPRNHGNRETNCCCKGFGSNADELPGTSSTPRMPENTVAKALDIPPETGGLLLIISSLKGAEALRHWRMLFM